MKRWFSASLSVLVFAASGAFANFHLFQVEQLFSNADGTVQFIVMHEFAGMNGENLWGGQSLISTQGGVNKPFVFLNNLPSFTTANRRVLIATQGFADLHIVTPDYTMPPGFLPTDGGMLNYAGFDLVTFPALPTDGATALKLIRNGNTLTTQMVPNLATNFAGQTGSVTATAAPAAIVPVPGVYFNPAESGSGFALDYKNGTLVVAVYSYLASGPSQWYLAAGQVTNNVFTATLDKYVGGQCISCTYKDPGGPFGNDGMITITFTSPTTATVDLPGGRHFQIQPFFQ